MDNKPQQYEGKGGLNRSSSGKLDLSKINMTALQKSLNELSIPRLFNQLVVFVIDGSRSMYSDSINGIAKGLEIEKAIKDIIKRLKVSKNSNSFDVSIFAFSDDYKNLFGIKQINEINEDQNFNPNNIIKKPGGTRLSDCLKEVKEVVEDYSEAHIDENCQTLILILSDGALNDHNEALKVINELKNFEYVTISAMYLESIVEEDGKYYSWDENTGQIDYSYIWTIDEVRNSHKRTAEKFKIFATDKTFFINTIDPEEVRKHMIKSISTVSVTAFD
jgi:uncharacterized protein YegL